ncbi:lytic transglycosylase domain-containing protein [Cupriavidus agavae]|uniref:Transglycosylase-like protein with SLT domain n=1 Tax=Cupriavidus agavae TaxID=1001822 RepID=A0A4Q7S578_9BURK|nr:lytic transglycosylase domain-containing protein [Cupriavidus agavae]RZT41554.1 transglycosylase-like protein with SLT domain [Cupriavidus agavae]
MQTSTRQPRWKGQARRLASAFAVLASFCIAVPAHAELWGYIDKDGVAHFADARLDSRYKLFMKDGGQFDSANLGHRGAVSLEGKSSPERERLFRVMLNHPNLRRVDPIIERVAAAHDVDPALVRAVMAVESGFNAGAVSPKGAIGLMQVIPDTGARFGVAADRERSIEQKLADPKLNISAGVRYLRFLTQLFPGNLELALAAYNAGEGAVQRYNNQIPPYPETRQYVSTVLEFYRLYQPAASDGPRVLRTGVAAERVKMVIGGRRPMP